MDKILVELLDKNSRVILPDFGAFIIKQKDPKVVIFNEFLRYNDGLLIDYVASSQNIDKEAAKVISGKPVLSFNCVSPIHILAVLVQIVASI